MLTKPRRKPAVIAELKRIRRHKGRLLPADVVDAARPVKSPLHQYFDWDDTEAGELWREHQARQLLRVVVTIIGDDESSIEVRAFQSLAPDRMSGGGYRLTVDVLSNPEWRQQLLDTALAELRAFQQKYKMLRELADIFTAIGKVERKLTK